MSDENTAKNPDTDPQTHTSEEIPKEGEDGFQVPSEYSEHGPEPRNYNNWIAVVLAMILVGTLAFFFLFPLNNSIPSTISEQHVNASQPAVAFVSLHPSALNVSLTYNARATTPNASINLSESNINWGDGALTDISNSTHTYSTYGTYTISLNVYDSLNGRNSTSRTISLTPPQPPKPPMVYSSPFPPFISFHVDQSGLLVRINGTILPYSKIPTSGVKITKISINWGDGITTDGYNEYIHNYSAIGTYNLKVTATDSLGDTSSANKTIVLTPNPNLQLVGFCPSISPSLTMNNPTIKGLTILLSGTQGPSVTSGTIDWGDGTTTFLDQYTHTYSGTGNYQINLTAYDKCGLRTSYHLHIQLSLTNYPPIVFLDQPNVTGYRVQLKGRIVPTALGASIDWSRTTIDWGDGNMTLALNGYMHNYSRPSTYNIAVVATDNLGDRNASIITLQVPISHLQSHGASSALRILRVGQNLSADNISVVLENVAGPDRNGTNDAIIGVYKDGLLTNTITMLPLSTYSVNASGTHLLVYVGQTFIGIAGDNWAELQMLPLRS